MDIEQIFKITIGDQIIEVTKDELVKFLDEANSLVKEKPTPTQIPNIPEFIRTPRPTLPNRPLDDKFPHWERPDEIFCSSGLPSHNSER